MKSLAKSLLIGSALTVAAVTTAAAQEVPERVGYIVNYATHEWYQNVIGGMQDRADELGIELEVLDANLDIARQVSAAEDFMARGVDVMIITPVNEEGVVPILRRARANGTPVVLEGNPVVGMDTLVAICDYDTGYHAGVAAGEYVNEHLGGEARVMNVGLPLLSATVLRSQGFMDGIRTQVPDAELVHDLDGGGNPDRSLEVSMAALSADNNINVIYGINDSSAIGGLQAWRANDLPEDNLLTVGTGGEGLAFINEMQQDNSYELEAAMFPEKVGFTAMNAAVSMYNGEELPEHIVSPTTTLTTESWQNYYDYDGSSRSINWDAVNALEPPAEGRMYAADLEN